MYPQGLGSMAPARLPGADSGAGKMIEITPPMYGPDAPPRPNDEVPGEQPIHDAEPTAIEKLIGQFENEIDIAEQGRQAKEQKWIKIDKYMAGEDVQDPPENYEESTFFYRRLPRIVQIGKAKLLKHVCPIHGRPWDARRPPVKDRNERPDKDSMVVSGIRGRIESMQENMGLENKLDDMCEFMSWLGGVVVYGPISSSAPRSEWGGGHDQGGVQEDTETPMASWEFFNPERVYPDPNSRKSEELEYVHFHHVLSSHQIRSLRHDPTFIDKELAGLLEDLPEGNWSGNMKPWEYSVASSTIQASKANRYVVWMRVGFLTIEALEALGESFGESTKDLKDIKGLDKEKKRALAESLWEIWFCGNHILKISKRKFQPEKMPVYFVPFRRDPTSIFGIGAAESALEVVEMLINICRAMDDTMADTSGFQAIVDAGSLANRDLTIRGRKVWFYRDKGSNRKVGPNGRPIEMFSVPSNMDQLIACFKLFESMLPIVTGIPEAVTGQDLGSGVRTDAMLNTLWDALEEFLKDVVGNVDRYWWKPHLNDAIAWIKQYDTSDAGIVQELAVTKIVVQGVRGALRRELVGRKIGDFYERMNQYGLPGWFDDVELAKASAEGMGLDEERAVLTPEQYVEKQKLIAMQKALEVEAGNAPLEAERNKERAHVSARDAVLESFKSVMSSDPHDPVTIPLMERVFRLTGQLDDKAKASLQIRAKMLVKYYEAQDVINAQQKAIIESPVQATNPLELAPENRDPAEAAAAAKTGQGVVTPPDALPAIPTTQRIVPESQEM